MIKADKSALRIKAGCPTPAPPASKVTVSKRVEELSAAACAEGILKGDRSVLARAITLIESTRANDREIAEDVLERCLPAAGKSIRVGVTGIPGAGKSC